MIPNRDLLTAAAIGGLVSLLAGVAAPELSLTSLSCAATLGGAAAAGTLALRSFRAATLAVTLMASSAALAQPPQEGGQRGEAPKPPREAIEACVELPADEVCGFEGREGDWVEGTCFKPDDAPADAPLACKPVDAPEGQPPSGGRAPRD
ncbi:MAG: hypothetical protein H6741_19830 [Alphaproteobacteria bacterium]|nr:hypothetical protein [Alphaproteobacteria bacterium]MCB9794956.1 hypothetical protein [Alphaproteobacteria bacterium]